MIKCDSIRLENRAIEYRLKMKFENGKTIDMIVFTVNRLITGIAPAAEYGDMWTRMHPEVRSRIITAAREGMKTVK